MWHFQAHTPKMCHCAILLFQFYVRLQAINGEMEGNKQQEEQEIRRLQVNSVIKYDMWSGFTLIARFVVV